MALYTHVSESHVQLYGPPLPSGHGETWASLVQMPLYKNDGITRLPRNAMTTRRTPYRYFLTSFLPAFPLLCSLVPSLSCLRYNVLYHFKETEYTD